MSITSYNLNGNVYEFLSGATIIDRFYLPDSYLSEPTEGDTAGVRISENERHHSHLLNAAELLAMGFASVALFTAQFNTDKANNSITNSLEGNVAAYTRKSFLVTNAALGSSTTAEITIAVPDEAMILGVSLNNDVAVTTSGGNNTYNAAFSGGSSTAIDTAILGALNTKTDKPFVPILTTAVTQITVTAGNSENFAGGTIQAVVYYEVLTSMADA